MELTEDQIKYKVAILLTLFTGVRLGELMGLEWDDINFKDGIICVNRSSQYLAEKSIFTKTPKNGKLYQRSWNTRFRCFIT